MIIQSNGLYLNRTGRQIGIVGSAKMPAASPWKWLTTRGYYVTAEGCACPNGGESVNDLVRDVSPSAAAVAGMDSTMQVLS